MVARLDLRGIGEALLEVERDWPRIDAELVRSPPERRQDLQLMKNLVHSHAQALAVYLCANCGFKARQFFWQCPACGGWETYPPRRTAELDSAERHLARMQIGQ